MELENQKEKYVLILGGSNFMGKSLLSTLSKNNNINLFFINRGRKHWNNEVSHFSNATFVYGNRDEGDDYKKLLLYITKKHAVKQWDFVIDFCCY